MSVSLSFVARRRRRLLLLIGLVALLVLIGAALVGCSAPPAAMPNAAAQAVATSTPVARLPELVRLIVQTERSVQVQHNDDGIEVAAAVGWPVLNVPVVVCVLFDGSPHPIKARGVQLLDRTACAGGQ